MSLQKLCRLTNKILGYHTATVTRTGLLKQQNKQLCRTTTSTFTSSSTLSTDYTVTIEDKLNIDSTAVLRLNEILDKDEFLRVLVEGGGCSGFQYKFEVDTEIDVEEDVTFHTEGGGRVVCDGVSLKILNGATLEFHKDLLRAGFRIVDIPQAEKGCSCGVSFSVKL